MPTPEQNSAAQRRSTPLRIDSSSRRVSLPDINRGSNQTFISNAPGPTAGDAPGAFVPVDPAARNPFGQRTLQQPDVDAFRADPFRDVQGGALRDFAAGRDQGSITQQELIDEERRIATDPNALLDPSVQAFRNQADIFQNQRSAALEGAGQGGLSPLALARETARFDAQTRNRVLAFIGQRQSAARQNLQTLLQQQQNRQLQRDQILQQAQQFQAQRRQQREASNPFNPRNLFGKLIDTGFSSLLGSRNPAKTAAPGSGEELIGRTNAQAIEAFRNDTVDSFRGF